MNERRRELIAEVFKDQNEKTAALLDRLPQGWRWCDIARVTYGSGVQVISYREEPFLELHPMEFSTTKLDETGLTITATWHYRYLGRWAAPANQVSGVEAASR